MRVLLDKEATTLGLRRLAGEIVERHRGTQGLVLVGIRRGGVPVARALGHWIAKLEGTQLPLGTVDITLYRDDAATALPNPRIGPSEIPVSIDGKNVVLVDDVAYTGRTVRAALDAVLDFGRPQRIELAVLVDRGQRELPIQPDFCVKRIELQSSERVDVIADSEGLEALVCRADAPSIPHLLS